MSLQPARLMAQVWLSNSDNQYGCNMKETLHKLISKNHLSREEMREVLAGMIDGKYTDIQIAGFLIGLTSKGLVQDELSAAACVMRERLIPVETPSNEIILDTCGTGGDVKGTYNISTASAILVAACGVKVVKHGNRSASNRAGSGSADVLEKLGLKLDLPVERLGECLKDTGICFAFARNHHPAMKKLAPIRTELAVPTMFNMMGPLLNPGRAKHQLLGTYSKQLAELMAGALKDLGSIRAWVVSGDDGLDEISTLGPSSIYELENAQINYRKFDPQSIGIPIAKLSDLQVDSVDASADAIRQITEGKKSAKRDIAALNAAAGLVITDKAANLEEGLKLVDQAIESGKAASTLTRLIQFA